MDIYRREICWKYKKHQKGGGCLFYAIQNYLKQSNCNS